MIEPAPPLTASVRTGQARLTPARPLADDRLDHVVGGAGTISPVQLDALLRVGAVPDPADIMPRSFMP